MLKTRSSWNNHCHANLSKSTLKESKSPVKVVINSKITQQVVNAQAAHLQRGLQDKPFEDKPATEQTRLAGELLDVIKSQAEHIRYLVLWLPISEYDLPDRLYPFLVTGISIPLADEAALKFPNPAPYLGWSKNVLILRNDSKIWPERFTQSTDCSPRWSTRYHPKTDFTCSL